MRPVSLKPARSSRTIAARHPTNREYGFPLDRPTHEWRLHNLSLAYTVPPKFVAAIEESRQLLELPPDWDDEGACAIHFDTWTRATRFLRNTVVKSGAAAALPVPTISACRDGSIDMFWETEKYRLLINISSSEDAGGDYYGETKSRLVVKGTFQPEVHDLSVVLKLLLDNA